MEGPQFLPCVPSLGKGAQRFLAAEAGECLASPHAEPICPSSGLCHPECGDQGCDGPNADQCLNCIHYSLGSVKTGR